MRCPDDPHGIVDDLNGSDEVVVVHDVSSKKRRAAAPLSRNLHSTLDRVASTLLKTICHGGDPIASNDTRSGGGTIVGVMVAQPHE